jgi:hypothetical protein
MADHDLKARWFDRGVEALNKTLIGPVIDFYVCPLCLEPFSRDQIDSHLTFEHAPPESVGGKRVALTCGPCNHTSGTRLDASLAREEDVRSFLRSGGESPYTVTVTREGVPVRGTFTAGPEVLAFDAISKQNDPKLLEQFEASAAAWAANPESGRSFTVAIPVRVNSRAAQLAWLKAAHVVAFGCFGYLYALQPALAVLLEQLRRPNEILIDPLPLGYDPNQDPDTRHISIITEPYEMYSIMVKIGRYTAYLPTLRDDHFFAKFNERLRAAESVAIQEDASATTLSVSTSEYPWPTEPLHIWDGVHR